MTTFRIRLLTAAALSAWIAHAPASAQRKPELLAERLVRDAVKEAAVIDPPAPPLADPATFGRNEQKQKRVDKLFQQAADAAVPRLYEAPKITEYNDGNPYGRKIYKVSSAMGTYCVTYDSNHTPNGIDIGRQGLKSKVGMCPIEF